METMNCGVSAEMPRYKCHKVVHALKIAAIETRADKSAVIAPADPGYAPFDVPAPWAERFRGTEEDLGYYVLYDDGFASWSPSKPFEEGYCRIIPHSKYDYLEPFDGPVIPGLEEHEVVYAKEQPQYNPLRTLRSNTSEYEVISRWTLTEEQRQAVAEGADVYLTLLTFGGPLQPIRMAVGKDPNPDFFRAQLGYSAPADAQQDELKKS